MKAPAFNLLDPKSAVDVAQALLDRSYCCAPKELQPAIVRLLARHIAGNEEHLAAVRRGPDELPAWAQGKDLWTPAPSPDLQLEVEELAGTMAAAAERVAREPGKTPDAQRSYLQAFLRGIPHLSWPELVDGCNSIGRTSDPVLVNRRVVRGLKLRVTKHLRWRRLRSCAELWEVTRGTVWCVREHAFRAEDALLGMLAGSAHYWVLEYRAEPVALLQFSPLTGQIVEVKGRDNHTPAASRRSVVALARKLGASFGEDACEDVANLCVETRMGGRKRPYWEGVLKPRWAERPLRYRLWADGRKRRYFMTVSDRPAGPLPHRLFLDAAAKEPQVVGTAPGKWSGSTEQVMRLALVRVRKRDRAKHWLLAQRAIRNVT